MYCLRQKNIQVIFTIIMEELSLLMYTRITWDFLVIFMQGDENNGKDFRWSTDIQK